VLIQTHFNRSVTFDVAITGSCIKANESEDQHDIRVDCEETNSYSSHLDKNLHKRHLKGSARENEVNFGEFNLGVYRYTGKGNISADI